MLARVSRSFLVLGAIVAGLAGAAEPELGVIPVNLFIGEAQTVSVGGAIGLICDDSSIVDASISGGKNGNEVSFKGLKEGTTLCRAGSDALGSKRMMRVRVTKPASTPDEGHAPVER